MLTRAYADAGKLIDPALAEQVVRECGGFGGYAESFLKHMGAREVESLDASAYEHATHIHDLNSPLPNHLTARYSLVIDGGSLEHVFNFPQALKNCMQAVEPDGHLALITPANNQFGHGFYQFSPDLFYRALSSQNGFQIQLMLILAAHRGARWRSIVDPAEVGARVTLTSPWQSLLFVLARRISDVEPFTTAPQQSDYTVAWSDPSRPVSNRLLLYQRLPTPIRLPVKAVKMLLGTTSGPGHFHRVDLAQLSR